MWSGPAKPKARRGDGLGPSPLVDVGEVAPTSTHPSTRASVPHRLPKYEQHGRIQRKPAEPRTIDREPSGQCVIDFQSDDDLARARGPSNRLRGQGHA